MFERILYKLIIFHLLILLIVQGFLKHTPLIKSLNNIYLYEGVGADLEENKMDVFDH
ncbi:hypothetical protein J6TS1_23870 [Siminovitchia terrae]|uniref:Uncharacterized protein n=1 Tax=Siminovitchia terrae TaxID=1914933 RepID=A0ABQ4KZ10_SIMTE|nr:DUF5359 family protein [Siminovitchia terrae]GIN92046.1 hypothetical protein J22TS1_30970 [Siminovitchia terrae]GIN96517.1 hypothetical protein J6TS1_23870 [Siminovitchia terrae]